MHETRPARPGATGTPYSRNSCRLLPAGVTFGAASLPPDPAVAARSGFTPQEIELDASALLQGEPATTPVVVNDRAYTIRVRFPDRVRANLDQIRNTIITSSSTGKSATLGSVAQFST